MNFIFLASCAVLCLVPVLFVLNDVYEDGLVGRVGLLGISFSAATFILEWANGEEYQMLPQTVFMVAMFAWFLCWHLFRFHTRVMRKQKQKDENQRQGSEPHKTA